MMFMKKIAVLFFVLCFLGMNESFAQYGRMYPSRYHRYADRDYDPSFTPSLSLSIGYGYPNLDKNEFLSFYNFYRGHSTETGPVHASIDYQLNRRSSVGIMVAYAKVSAPYYDYNGTATSSPSFQGKLEDWSILFTWCDTYQPAESFLLI